VGEKVGGERGGQGPQHREMGEKKTDCNKEARRVHRAKRFHGSQRRRHGEDGAEEEKEVGTRLSRIYSGPDRADVK